MVTLEVRRLMRFARPMERASHRFSTGPGSTVIFVTLSASASAFSLAVAFATAELSTLLSILAALRCWKFRMEMASAACRPRIMSATIRTFRGDWWNFLNIACAMTCTLPSLLLVATGRGGSRSSARSAPATSRGLAVTGVGHEDAGRRKLAKLVPDHVFRDEHGEELAAVVNGEGKTDHLR